MTNSVSKSSIIPGVWKNFYDRIKSQVTTVTITGSTVVPVQNWVADFPDQLIDTKSEYPIIVVRDPKTPTDTFTATKTKLTGTIEIEVFANQAEAASKLIAQVINSIETYKGDLAKVGIRQITNADTNQDSATRGKIKLHLRSIVFNFTLFYTNTQGF